VEAGFRPDALTAGALFTGLLAAVLFAAERFLLGWLCLVFSGLLDALDGRVARLGSGPSAWGGVLDLVSDRIVEAAVLLALSGLAPGAQPSALFLLATWYVNITVFLAVGAASRMASEKLIHYPPGLLERSEALLFCTLALLFPQAFGTLCVVYGLLGLATAGQRLWYAHKVLAAP
jgi:phosphatidylglycerophosphate synthase